MTALMIANITVKDPAIFKDYMAETQRVAAPYGAEMVSRSQIRRPLAGAAPDHQLTVIVRFPELAAIDNWYESSEYQNLIALREAGAEMTMTSYEEMV